MVTPALWLSARRVIDLAVSLVASVPLAFLGSLSCLAVFIEDRNRPWVQLERVGVDGASFDLIKIRSMRVAHGGAAITGAQDARITRSGRVLRKVRMDEIPQLLHVITGKMSLIGPRPEDPRFVDLSDDRWQAVLQARPGIAGMTQVLASLWEAEHLNGVTSEETYRELAVPAKLAIDEWYVRNASPLLDLKVVISIAQIMLGAEWTPIHSLANASIPEAQLFLKKVPG